MEQKQITTKQDILKLIRQLVHDKLPFYLRTGLKEYSVKVLRIKENELMLDCGGYIKTQQEYVNFYFLLKEYVYFGQLKLNKTTRFNEIYAQTPNVIFRRAQRKYNRVAATEYVSCKFNVISPQRQQNKPQPNMPLFMKNIYNELNKDVPDVKKIFAAVLEEVKKISSNSEIKFYKKDEEMNIIEKTIKVYKKALFIQDTYDVRNYMVGYNSPFYMSFGALFQHKIKNQGWNQKQITDAAAKLMEKDKSLNRLSYIYVPIFKFGDIVGHIYSSYHYNSNKKFTEKNVLFLRALGDIISEALTKNTLFQTGDEDQPKIRVDNISRGGMKISVYDAYLLKFLQIGVHLSIMATIDERSANMTGEILRTDKQELGVGLGIKFIEIKPNDEKVIKDFVEGFSKSQLFD